MCTPIRFLAALFLILTHSFLFAQKALPELWGQRIHDDAKVLSPQTIDQLERQLKIYQDSTSNQIAVLIIQTLDGEAIEEYSIRVAEKWKLGTEKKDNGVLLVIAIDDHKMRIEVGLGLEGVLTDAQSNRIIRNEMAPAFRRNDYDAGVIAAVNSIIKAIDGEYAADESDSSNDFDSMDLITKIVIGSCLFIFLGIFSSIGLFSKGRMTWALYAFLIPFYAIFMGLIFSWYIFFGYVILYPLLRWWIVKSGRTLLKWQSGGSSSGSGSSWSSGGGGWSSGSGSSFSGGGGSFGGGGSSGGW